MKTKFYLSTLLVLVVIARGQTINITHDGRRFKGEIIKTFTVSGGGALDMKVSGGDITVTGEERNSVEITEAFRINTYTESDAREILQTEQTRYLQRGNTIIIQTSPQRSRRYSSDFNVKIPHEFDLQIFTSGGDIDVSKVGGKVNLNTSGGDIEMFGLKGQITARTSGGDVCLTRSAGNVTLSTSGGDLAIRELVGDLNATTSGGDIDLKDVQANGQVSTSGGDINLLGVKAKAFKAVTSGGDIGADKIDADLFLRTSGGDLVIGEIKNNLEAHTSGGDVDIRKVEKNLKASTSGGDIRVGVVKGYCELRTSGGDIEVGKTLDLLAYTSGGNILVNGALGTVEAHTSGGDIETHKLYIKGVSNNSLNLETSGGNILVYVPENLPANIDAAVIINKRWNADAGINSDFPIKIVREEKGSRLYLYGKGVINGGGDIIKLRTVDGSIRIIKSTATK